MLSRPSPELHGRRHEADMRAFVPCVYAPEAPGRAMGAFNLRGIVRTFHFHSTCFCGMNRGSSVDVFGVPMTLSHAICEDLWRPGAPDCERVPTPTEPPLQNRRRRSTAEGARGGTISHAWWPRKRVGGFVHRRIVHRPGEPLLMDARLGVRKKPYYAVLMGLDGHLEQSSHIPSDEPLLYYKLLLSGAHVEPGLGNEAYKDMFDPKAGRLPLPALYDEDDFAVGGRPRPPLSHHGLQGWMLTETSCWTSWPARLLLQRLLRLAPLLARRWRPQLRLPWTPGLAPLTTSPLSGA